jgi:hypothetical protein
MKRLLPLLILILLAAIVYGQEPQGTKSFVTDNAGRFFAPCHTPAR